MVKSFGAKQKEGGQITCADANRWAEHLGNARDIGDVESGQSGVVVFFCLFLLSQLYRRSRHRPRRKEYIKNQCVRGPGLRRKRPAKTGTTQSVVNDLIARSSVRERHAFTERETRKTRRKSGHRQSSARRPRTKTFWGGEGNQKWRYFSTFRSLLSLDGRRVVRDIVGPFLTTFWMGSLVSSISATSFSRFFCSFPKNQAL